MWSFDSISAYKYQLRVGWVLVEICNWLGKAIDQLAFFFVDLEVDAADLGRHDSEQFRYVPGNLQIGGVSNFHRLDC